MSAKICEAQTKTGKKCTRSATSDSKFCWQHKTIQSAPQQTNVPSPNSIIVNYKPTLMYGTQSVKSQDLPQLLADIHDDYLVDYMKMTGLDIKAELKDDYFQYTITGNPQVIKDENVVSFLKFDNYNFTIGEKETKVDMIDPANLPPPKPESDPNLSRIWNIPEGTLPINKIPTGQIDHLDYDFPDLGFLTQVIKRNLKTNLLKKGDVIHFDDYSDYRNDGKVLWDGHQAIFLADDYDEYGSVPLSMTINQFPRTDFFTESIDHNNYVWFDYEGYQAGQPKKMGMDPDINATIYEVTYNKINPKVEGNQTYKVYTLNPSLLASHEEEENPMLLTGIGDEFGVKFNGPQSLFHYQSFTEWDENQ
jgi:hypothetical protein